jgi:non-ribosomal peptide synthetase-like protein
VTTNVEGRSAKQLAAEFAEILGEVLGTAAIDPGAGFFEDLGADSLTMAKFCSRVRKRADLPKVSMKDVYRSPSLAALATHLAATAAPAAVTADPSNAPAASVVVPQPALLTEPVPASAPVAPVGRIQYFLCGLAQAVLLLALPVALAAAMVLADDRLTGADGLLDTYLRTLAFSGALVTAAFVVPVGVKWLLVGRWKPTEIRIWSWGYLRFWVVKSVVQKNPLIHLLSGSPLLNLYLRALGARVGRGTTILAAQIPVCTDLVSIGSRSILHKNVMLSGYHAQAGVIRIGTVTIGDRVLVGTRSVLDIDTVMGDDSQLGHASALYRGQIVPAGERWHGCPARAGGADFRTIEERWPIHGRRIRFGIFQLLNLVAFGIPLSLLVLAGLYELPSYLTGTAWGDGRLDTASFYGIAAGISALLFLGPILVGLPLLAVVTRLVGRFVRPGRVYPLHGSRHALLRFNTRVTNMKFYATMTADCSFVVHYLRMVGWRLKPYVQTGTNFGVVMHDDPFTVSVGKGTVVADGLMATNVDYSATTFRISPVAIGSDNFLGNHVVYPAAGRTGDNCLLATMVMVPIDGPVREGVGLLGSPPIEIPRTVARDHGLAVTDPQELRRGLRRKNRHNAVTLMWFLLVRWFVIFAGFIAAEGAGELWDSLGTWALVACDAGFALFLFAFYTATERAVTRWATLAPDGVSIYSKAFWRHERYWKIPSHTFVQIFNGTVFKGLCWRLQGAKIGKRLFDDGAGFVERCYVHIGDHVTLNSTGTVQNHSQEDGAFKSDRTYLGDGVTLGPGAFVHYGVTVGEDAVIGTASFLMKGEQVPAGEHWGGNPAEPIERPARLQPQPQLQVEAAPTASIPAPRSARFRLVLAGYASALGGAGAWVTLGGAVAGNYPVIWAGFGAAAWLTGLFCLAAVAVDTLRTVRRRTARPETVATPLIPRQPGPVQIIAPRSAPASEVIEPRAVAIEEPAAIETTAGGDAWTRLSAQLDVLEQLQAKWFDGDPVGRDK